MKPLDNGPGIIEAAGAAGWPVYFERPSCGPGLLQCWVRRLPLRIALAEGDATRRRTHYVLRLSRLNTARARSASCWATCNSTATTGFDPPVLAARVASFARKAVTPSASRTFFASDASQGVWNDAMVTIS